MDELPPDRSASKRKGKGRLVGEVVKDAQSFAMKAASPFMVAFKIERAYKPGTVPHVEACDVLYDLGAFNLGVGGKRATIGRSSDCDIVLRSQSCSRLHCNIGFDVVSLRFFVSDAGSRYGTSVNHRKLERGEQYLLEPRSLIACGKESLVFLTGKDVAEALIDSALL